MDPETVWQNAERPNYKTNVDKKFAHSEEPYEGQKRLTKIPPFWDGSIPHVNYWGEGKTGPKDPSSFANCYNVNLQYQLVSSGPDKGRKIPNRIPVLSYTNCDTSNYLRYRTVLFVTVDAKKLTDSSAKDIARITKYFIGTVIVYGVDKDAPELQTLKTELKKVELTPNGTFVLPPEFVSLKFDKYVAFNKDWPINVELQYYIHKRLFENIDIKFRKLLNASTSVAATKESIRWLITTNPENILSCTYYLWKNGARDIVENHFPKAFRLIHNENAVAIVNKKFNCALKLTDKSESNDDGRATAHNLKIAKEASWKFIPYWKDNKLSVKLYNVNYRQYLRLDSNFSLHRDRRVWGSIDSGEEQHMFYLFPIIVDGNISFNIFNKKYDQGLLPSYEVETTGERIVWGYFGTIYNEGDRGKWIIEAWNSSAL